MSLKNDFLHLMKEELLIPLVGVASPDDFSQEEIKKVTPVLQLLANSTPLAQGMDTVLHPGDFMPEVRSVIITGTPCYFGKLLSFEQCRENLLGITDPLHVSPEYFQHIQEKKMRMSEFFENRGFSCLSITGGQFPIKLAASKCGIGYYGKNSILQHPDYGSWISLSAYVTDAELETDDPTKKDCGDCCLCINACPTGALSKPYMCNSEKCLNFHLAWNKNTIPDAIREKCENLLEENCNVCRDICPKNHNLKPINTITAPEELIYPSLQSIAEITDEEWENGYALTLAGFFLFDKKYLQRNAIIAMGNFRDKRCRKVLQRLTDCGDDELKEYAAWALGRIS
jgi:epoxyqueuosine reductase